MNRPLRVGVVGLGFGARVHVPGWRAVPGVDVIGICGRDPVRTQAEAVRLGIAPFGSMADLVAQRLDIVSLALPPDQNESTALLALRENVAVLCEKPLAATLPGAERIARAARNQTGAMDFEFAELATFRHLRQLMHTAPLGPVTHMEITWLTRSWAHENREWSWKTDRRRGGGVLSLLGAHVLYAIEWLIGPITQISASLDTSATSRLAPTGQIPAPDRVQARLATATGVDVSLDLGNAVTGIQEHRWVIVCPEGSIELANDSLDPVAGFRLSIKRDSVTEPLETETRSGSQDSRVSPFTRLATRFAADLRNGRPATPDLTAGLRVQALIDAIERAAATRSTMTIGRQ